MARSSTSWTTGQGATARPMRIWAGGGLAQQSSSERLVDDGAKGSKDDLSLQGHYGLPVSCERFCRSVTAGRLPACVFVAFELFWPEYLGAQCRRRVTCITPLLMAAARSRGVTKSSGTRRSSLGCGRVYRTSGHFALGCFLVGRVSVIHARVMMAVGGCPDVFG